MINIKMIKFKIKKKNKMIKLMLNKKINIRYINLISQI